MYILMQRTRYHLWTPASAIVTCPSAMADGAARLLSIQLSTTVLPDATRTAFESAYYRLTSRDPSIAWTSGQWMTERKGGSDVSGTETLAMPIGASLRGKGGSCEE